MSRLAMLVLPLLVTPAHAHMGLHHHPHGIEFGWITAALVGSVAAGGAARVILRRRK
jgi:hypothetical protein